MNNNFGGANKSTIGGGINLGGNTGGGLSFGNTNNQSKPLFGSNNQSSGLSFGNTNKNTNTNTGGGMFSTNNAKPLNTGILGN